MLAFELLLQRHPLVFMHLVTAFGALVVGIVIMARRKGSFSHKRWGWAFVVLMACTTLASAFIRDYQGPNLAGFTPIHVFTLAVAVMLPWAIWFIRRGNVNGHRKMMRGLFYGACVVAGIFTLLPGRFLGALLWHNWLGVMS
jgi:uncharacterized membrane protein